MKSHNRNFAGIFSIMILACVFFVTPVSAPPILVSYVTQIQTDLNPTITITDYSVDYNVDYKKASGEIRNFTYEIFKFEVDLSLNFSIKNNDVTNNSFVFAYASTLDGEDGEATYSLYEFNLTVDNQNMTIQTYSISNFDEIPTAIASRLNLYPHYDTYPYNPEVFDDTVMRVEIVNITLPPLEGVKCHISNLANFSFLGEIVDLYHYFDNQKLSDDDTNIESSVTLSNITELVRAVYSPSTASNYTYPNDKYEILWNFTEVPTRIKVQLMCSRYLPSTSTSFSTIGTSLSTSTTSSIDGVSLHQGIILIAILSGASFIAIIFILYFKKMH